MPTPQADERRPGQPEGVGDPRAGAAHWIEVDGRRWRATDPGIPPRLRQELVDELMRSRRAVKILQRCGDEGLLAAAHRDVHGAKVALGERGEPWWDEPTPEGQRTRLGSTILALAGHRGPGSSICPSDAARVVGGASWRSLVPVARSVARRLADEGRVEVTQRGEVLDPSTDWRGPVRIRIVPPRASGSDVRAPLP